MVTATQIATTTALSGTIGPAMDMALVFGDVTAAATESDALVTTGTNTRGLITDAHRLSGIVRGATRRDAERMNAVLAPSASQVAALGQALTNMQMAFSPESQRVLDGLTHGADSSVRAVVADIARRNAVSPLVSQMQHLAPSALLALYRDRDNFDRGTGEAITAAVQSSSSRWLRFRAALHDLWQKLKA